MPVRTLQMVVCPLHVPDKTGMVYTQANLKSSVDMFRLPSYGCIDPVPPIVMFPHLSNVSHSIRKLWFSGYYLMSEIQVLDTPQGKVAKSLLDSGVPMVLRPYFLKEDGNLIIKGIDFYMNDIFEIPSIELLRKKKLETLNKINK